MDPLGAQEEVMEVAAKVGLPVTVAVAYELLDVDTGLLQKTLPCLACACVVIWMYLAIFVLQCALSSRSPSLRLG